MNRKMTFFARGPNCGGRGSSGLTSFRSPDDATDRCSPRSEARATPPSPRPQRLKKWRRVSERRAEGAVGGCMAKARNYKIQATGCKKALKHGCMAQVKVTNDKLQATGFSDTCCQRSGAIRLPRDKGYALRPPATVQMQRPCGG